MADHEACGRAERHLVEGIRPVGQLDGDHLVTGAASRSDRVQRELFAVEGEVALGAERGLAHLDVVGIRGAPGQPDVLHTEGRGRADDGAHVERALHVVEDEPETPFGSPPPPPVEALHASAVELLHVRPTRSRR